jgi:hypothetical protein
MALAHQARDFYFQLFQSCAGNSCRFGHFTRVKGQTQLAFTRTRELEMR